MICIGLHATAVHQKGADERKKGLSAKGILIPAAVLVAIFHVLIILNTVRINNMGNEISEATQFNFATTGMSNNYSAGTDAMAQLAQGYAAGGEAALVGEYLGKAAEVGGIADGLYAKLKAGNYEGAWQLMQASMDAVERRKVTEMYAIRLRAEADGLDLSDYPELSAIPLAAEDQQLPAEALTGKALGMLADGSYQSTRGDVQRNVSQAVGIVGVSTSQFISGMSETLSTYRLLQWILTCGAIGILAVVGVLLFTRLINPIEKCVEIVQRGEAVPSDRGFLELQRLASSYDELLAQRNRMEGELRLQSRTDALTGMKNRLAFQEYTHALSMEKPAQSVAVFSMDVNGLKETNDTKGHVYGDQLLRDAAAAIITSFGNEDGSNCFRFGGDEFAAFLLGVSEEDALKAIERFRGEQKKYGLSISTGYAYAEHVGDTMLSRLYDRADQNMYREKAELRAER